MEAEVDTVIVAVGQQTAAHPLAEQAAIHLKRSGRIEADSFTQETEAPLVFAGGDAVTGPSIVLEAVGAGERAAVAINEKLSEDLPLDLRPEPFWRRPIRNDISFDPEAEPVATPRLKHEGLPLAERRGFVEVELAITENVAEQECLRCLRCDYRVGG
jgi:pyruvate/2-oxoglutarate dehydrogenase complex dihydrolipoamide dehydrogenase (E3) component